MSVLNRLKKLGMTVALASALTLIVPVAMPMNASTTMVSAATAKISNKKLTLITGKSKTLKVTGTKSTVKWSSSDKTVATVSSKGKVTAKSYGTATITAKVDNKKLTCKVTVKAYEGETLSFNSGANFVIPEGWISIDGSATGMERKVVALSNESTSYFDLRVIATNPMSNEDFTEYIKSLVTEPTQEAALELGYQVDLTTATFKQEESTKDNVAVVSTYIEYTMEDAPAIQVIVYDIYDGTYMYELIGMNFYDTEINYVEYLSYMVENISFAE